MTDRPRPRTEIFMPKATLHSGGKAIPLTGFTLSVSMPLSTQEQRERRLDNAQWLLLDEFG